MTTMTSEPVQDRLDISHKFRSPEHVTADGDSRDLPLGLVAGACTCTCAACLALAKRYEADPDLLAFYRRRLLIRGWAGRPDDIERAFILAHAEWAQQAARVGAQNLRRREKAHVEMASPAGVVRRP